MLRFYKKRSNGEWYNYVYDTIYINKSHTVRKSTSIGRTNSTVEKQSAIQQFTTELIQQEAKLRSQYWAPIASTEFTKYCQVEAIEVKRTELVRTLEYADTATKRIIETSYTADAIFNSNHIEGSQVPHVEVQRRIVHNDTKQNEEVGNMVRAMRYLEDAFIWNTKHIVQLHAIMLAHEPSKHGLKKEVNTVFNHTTTDPKNVRLNLKDLLIWLKQQYYKLYPPELAFEFYYRFERIHPFSDGNGRIGRLLMNQILTDHAYYPIIIWSDNKTAHTTAFEKHMNSMADRYFKFMTSQLLKTYQTYAPMASKVNQYLGNSI